MIDQFLDYPLKQHGADQPAEFDLDSILKHGSVHAAANLVAKQQLNGADSANDKPRYKNYLRKRVDSEAYWFVRLFLFSSLLFVVGIVLLWPALIAGHSRLEPWWDVLIWVGDAAAFLGFAWIAFSLVVIGPNYDSCFEEDAMDQAKRFKKERRTHWFVMSGIVIGLLFDLGVSIALTQNEEALFNKGTLVTATVTALKTEHDVSKSKQSPPQHYTSFQFEYEFTNPKDGESYRGYHRERVYHAERKLDFPKEFGEEAKFGLQSGEPGFPITAKFDPNFPNRNWIAKKEFNALSGILGLSTTVLFLQFGLVVYAISTLYEKRRVQSFDAIRATPFVIEAFVILVAGIMQWHSGIFSF